MNHWYSRLVVQESKASRGPGSFRLPETVFKRKIEASKIASSEAPHENTTSTALFPPSQKVLSMWHPELPEVKAEEVGCCCLVDAPTSWTCPVARLKILQS